MKTQEWQADLLAHADKYEFHPMVAKIQNFCSEDLGGFYLDILKDRLYTNAPDSNPSLGANCVVAHHPVARARDGTDFEFHR